MKRAEKDNSSYCVLRGEGVPQDISLDLSDNVIVKCDRQEIKLVANCSHCCKNQRCKRER